MITPAVPLQIPPQSLTRVHQLLSIRTESAHAYPRMIRGAVEFPISPSTLAFVLPGIGRKT